MAFAARKEARHFNLDLFPISHDRIPIKGLDRSTKEKLGGQVPVNGLKGGSTLRNLLNELTVAVGTVQHPRRIKPPVTIVSVLA